MSQPDQLAREPEPTEFNVILEGGDRHGRIVRIPSVRVRYPDGNRRETERLLTVELTESERPPFKWPAGDDVVPIVLVVPTEGTFS